MVLPIICIDTVRYQTCQTTIIKDTCILFLLIIIILGCYSPSKLDETLSCSKCSSEESLQINRSKSNNNNNNNNVQNPTSVPPGCNNCTNEKTVKKDKSRRHSHEWSSGCRKNKKKGGSSCECDSESCDFVSSKKVNGFILFFSVVI